MGESSQPDGAQLERCESWPIFRPLPFEPFSPPGLFNSDHAVRFHFKDLFCLIRNV
jgi:hypothetical protein